MRAEILRSIEKRLRSAQPDQAELLAITQELQAILGYVQKRQALQDCFTEEYTMREWSANEQEFWGKSTRYKPGAKASGGYRLSESEMRVADAMILDYMNPQEKE